MFSKTEQTNLVRVATPYGEQIIDIDSIDVGTPTFWGIYRGLSLDEDEFFHVFSQRLSDPITGEQTTSITLISADARVHQNSVIRPGVYVEAGAVIPENGQILDGAIVTERSVVRPMEPYHHLSNIRDAIDATPQATPPEPSQPQPGDVVDQSYSPQQSYAVQQQYSGPYQSPQA